MGLIIWEITMTDVSDFEKSILEKIDKGEDLTKSELLRLVTKFDHDDHIDDEDYFEFISTIVKIQDKYFAIEWEYHRGQGSLNERNTEFPSQPVKVSLETRIEKHERWVDEQGRVIF